ncbi:hypothetical protein MVES_000445 [Malassezia vespertilionis]|uniref:Uncharacterized protein n=1 Tax=Malassezia vespertilionis TaxID=2020962 RepID=A0A2N1JFU9_9BASI|nr:hypothetical protein MVES_000445 [Malassezia vespertilionis]
MSAFRASTVAFRAMRPSAPARLLKPEFQPHFADVSPSYMSKWIPSLIFWGATGGVFVTLALSGVPKFDVDVLEKTPLIDNIPDSDKPF